jgi:multimeric flavodoxin WrbA
MKILAINGSNRGKHGYTQFLIDKVFEGAKANGAECETIMSYRNVISIGVLVVLLVKKKKDYTNASLMIKMTQT